MCRHAGGQAVFEIGSAWHRKGDEKEKGMLRKRESVMRNSKLSLAPSFPLIQIHHRSSTTYNPPPMFPHYAIHYMQQLLGPHKSNLESLYCENQPQMALSLIIKQTTLSKDTNNMQAFAQIALSSNPGQIHLKLLLSNGQSYNMQTEMILYC